MRHDLDVLDYYEALQLSPNADAEMIQATYRTLVRRYHPDNLETGDAEWFRLVTEAHDVLGDPISRAKYDAATRDPQAAPPRTRPATPGMPARNDFQSEQACRLMVLEALYTRRRIRPGQASILPAELAELTGATREQLEFTMWFLAGKGLVQRADNSGVAISVAGVEYLEQHSDPALQRRLLQASLGLI